MSDNTIYQNKAIQVTEKAIHTNRISINIDQKMIVNMVRLNRKKFLPILLIILGSGLLLITLNTISIHPLMIPYFEDTFSSLGDGTPITFGIYLIHSLLLIAGGILLLIFVYKEFFVVRVTTTSSFHNIYKSKNLIEVNNVINAINVAISRNKSL